MEIFFQVFFDALEIIRHFAQSFQIQTGIVVCPLEGCYDGLGARLAGRTGEGRNRGVDDVDAGFDGFEIGHIAQR